MRKAIAEFCLAATLFAVLLVAANGVPWLRLMGVEPTVVVDKESQLLWKLASLELNESTDSTVIAPVDSIVNRICTANGIDRSRVKLHVCHTPDVNAFATVGGHLVVFSGLIRESRNEQELAGVLCHELAHVELGHVRQGVQIQLAVTAATIFISQSANGDLANLASNLLLNAISRDRESEADLRAVELMERAGLDPHHLANFLERMTTMKLFEFISDHPDSQSRADDIRSRVKHRNVVVSPILHGATWQELQDRL